MSDTPAPSYASDDDNVYIEGKTIPRSDRPGLASYGIDPDNIYNQQDVNNFYNRIKSSNPNVRDEVIHELGRIYNYDFEDFATNSRNEDYHKQKVQEYITKHQYNPTNVFDSAAKSISKRIKDAGGKDKISQDRIFDTNTEEEVKNDDSISAFNLGSANKMWQHQKDIWKNTKDKSYWGVLDNIGKSVGTVLNDDIKFSTNTWLNPVGAVGNWALGLLDKATNNKTKGFSDELKKFTSETKHMLQNFAGDIVSDVAGRSESKIGQGIQGVDEYGVALNPTERWVKAGSGALDLGMDAAMLVQPELAPAKATVELGARTALKQTGKKEAGEITKKLLKDAAESRGKSGSKITDIIENINISKRRDMKNRIKSLSEEDRAKLFNELNVSSDPADTKRFRVTSPLSHWKNSKVNDASTFTGNLLNSLSKAKDVATKPLSLHNVLPTPHIRISDKNPFRFAPVKMGADLTGMTLRGLGDQASNGSPELEQKHYYSKENLKRDYPTLNVILEKHPEIKKDINELYNKKDLEGQNVGAIAQNWDALGSEFEPALEQGVVQVGGQTLPPILGGLLKRAIMKGLVR